MALLVTIIFVTILTAVAVWAMSLTTHQRYSTDVSVARRMIANYHAQGGIIDAQWRIHNNNVTLITSRSPLTTATLGGTLCSGAGASDFSNPNWNPNKYYIDLESDTASLTQRTAGANIDDVEVDVSAVGRNNDCSNVSGNAPLGVRTIETRGFDT